MARSDTTWPWPKQRRCCRDRRRCTIFAGNYTLSASGCHEDGESQGRNLPVTKNGERAGGSGEIHAHEAADAGALNLENIIIRRDGEIVATEGEADVGERITLLTFHRVLAVESFLGSNLLVEQLGKSRREGDQRSAGVEDDASVVEISSRLAEGDGIEIDLPVGLASEWDLDHLTSIVAAVNATKGCLRLGSIVGTAKVKGKDRLVKKTLVDHVVKWWGNVVDGNGIIAEAEDTIEAAKSKGQTRFAGSLSEQLIFDLEVSNTKDVLGDEASHLTRAISDTKFRPVLLVSRRGRRIVLLVEVARNGSAFGARDPKVRASGIENDLEFLRWRSQGNGAEIWSSLAQHRYPAHDSTRTLRIQEILDRNLVRAVSVDGCMSEDVLGRASHGLLTVFVAEGSHVVADVGSTLCKSQTVCGPGRAQRLTHQLGLQRHLLKLHAMHACVGRTQQRSGCENNGVLHRHNHQRVLADESRRKDKLREMQQLGVY